MQVTVSMQSGITACHSCMPMHKEWWTGLKLMMQVLGNAHPPIAPRTSSFSAFSFSVQQNS